ncbi:MAG: hypothetical protein HRT87_01055 [Legionellales bacterium]|nr:hypothetical protein [Legionellales bacterium]
MIINTKLWLMLGLTLFSNMLFGATVLHNTIKRNKAVWITFSSIKYTDDKSEFIFKRNQKDEGDIEIVVFDGQHVNLDKALRKNINGYNILAFAFGSFERRPKHINKFILIDAKITDIKIFEDTDCGFKRIKLTTEFPYQIKFNATNTLKISSNNKITLKN